MIKKFNFLKYKKQNKYRFADTKKDLNFEL